MIVKLKKLLFFLLFVLFALIFLVSAYMLYQEFSVYKKGTSEYSSIVEQAVTVNEDAQNEWEKRVVDFDKLYQINPETVGWIYIPDTHIDYPVVKGKDNNKYLNTLFSGERNKAGTVFVDYRHANPFENKNTTMYGHNMRNKSMFHDLLEYRNQDFYNSHKTAYFYTRGGTYVLKIFSAYTTGANDVYVQTDLGENPQETIDALVKKSEIKADITPSIDSTIVTLSTCAYNFNNARCIVHAVVEKV